MLWKGLRGIRNKDGSQRMSKRHRIFLVRIWDWAFPPLGYLPLSPGDRGVLLDQLDSGRPVGLDAHAKFFDDKVIAENIEAAVDVGETQGQLQEQADTLLDSALQDKAVPHQELQEEPQVHRQKGDHEDDKVDRDGPDAGSLPDPVLGVLSPAHQDADAPIGTKAHDAHGKEEAKDLQGEEDPGAPGAIGHVVEAFVVLHLPVKSVDGDASNPHQDPEYAADPKGLPGGPEVADQEWVLHGQEPVQADEADGENTPVHADEVEALHQRAEATGWGVHFGQDHLEREREHKQ